MAAPPRSPKNIRIRVAATEAGPYTSMSMARSYDHSADTTGVETLEWFGGEAIGSGKLEDTGEITVWWDPADTTGQDLMRDSRDNQENVFLQIAQEGTEATKKVKQMEIRVRSYTEAGDVTAQGIEQTYAYTAIPGSIEIITLA